MLSYPFTASSQPTNPASQNLNRGLLSRELKNELRCLKFTLRLPLVEIDESIPNGAKCIICKEFYGQSFQIRGPELGCQLPCKCIIGHLCAWRYFAPFEGAHVTCPVCHMKFSELANDGGVSCPTPDFSRQNHEEAANNQLKQLEIATGLHFVSKHSSLEASLLEPSNEAINIKKETASMRPDSCSSQVDNNAIKSPRKNLLRRSSSRPLSVARAAIKAIDLVAKRSG